MSRKTLLILNPESGSGATGRRRREIESRLRDRVGEFEVAQTRFRRDAEELARKAAEGGIDRLIVAGGDGTASEAASGLLASGRGASVELGLLPLGTGGDLARGLGLPRDLDAAIDGIARGGTRCIDAGRIQYRGRDGEPAVSHFLNVGGFGLSGLTDEYVRQSPRIFGGTVAFAIAAIRSIIDYRARPAELRIDGELVHSGPVSLAVAANGRYFGGGMKIAPGADFASGEFEIVIIGGLGKLALLRKFPKLFSGAHVNDDAARFFRGRCLEAGGEPGSALLDIDGEPLGTLPARFEILPRAIVMCGVSEPASGST